MTRDPRCGPTRPTPARLVWLAALLALIGVLAACSGSSKAADSPTTSTTSGSPATSAAPSTGSTSSASTTSTTSTAAPVTTPSEVSTQPAAGHTTQPAVKITATASFGGRVTAKISKVAAITATARGPGEISGPAVALTLAITNGSAASISLANSVVNLYYGATQVPGIPMSGPPSSPFAGALGAGKTASSVYVFTIPVADRANVLITISYSPSAPVVQFTGSAR